MEQDQKARGSFWRSGRIDVRKIWATMQRYPILPIVILSVFVFLAIFGSLISPYDPIKPHFHDVLTPPFWMEGGSTEYLLGTDHLGRDLLSRIICGAAVSMQVGLLAVTLAGVIGGVFGLLSGYLGGWVDTVIMRLTDVVLALPFLMLVLVLAAILGPSKENIIILLGAVGWCSTSRVTRGDVLRVKQLEFVTLAVAAGASKIRIMLRHILPNVTNNIVVLLTMRVGRMIIAEASLSFMGLGIPPPEPAWGSMVADGRSYITVAWWICVSAGAAIFLVVMSCNLLGDWLRVRLDPKFRQL